MQDVPEYNRALQIYEKNLSLRAKRLQGLESYVDGTQYAGLPDWFSDTKPLWERAPCIVYPIVKNAIDSNGDLLLGQGRFPIATVEGLEGDNASTFEKVVARIIKQARLPAVSRVVFEAAQGAGSACAIFGVRGGRLFIDTMRAAWCSLLAADGSVRHLEIRYPYITVIETAHGRKAVCRLFRRVIDDKTDVTYFPVDALEDGREPKNWTVDVEVKHSLGFCPVVWYAHMRGCPIHGDVDGKAIHERLTDEIRAHDFALSQRHRAALYAGDPQWTEIGVQPGYNPTATGRRAEVPASITGRPGERAHAAYVSGPPTHSKARKKSPGTVWQYEDKETKVQLHALPGDALKALDDHANDLRSKLSEGLGVVFLDLDKLPSESRLSGRGLEVLKARQLDRVDNYRDDFGDRFLIPALGMLLRIAIRVGLAIDGLDVIARIAKASDWSWHFPSLLLMWGSYYRASGEEEELIVRALVQAKDAGLATQRVCVEKLRGILDVKDIDSYLAELKKEIEANEKKAAEAAKAEAALKSPAPKVKDAA
jgi:hypothetical protein